METGCQTQPNLALTYKDIFMSILKRGQVNVWVEFSLPPGSLLKDLMGATSAVIAGGRLSGEVVAAASQLPFYAAYRNGGSSKLRSLRECNEDRWPFRISRAASPIMRCSL